MVIWIKRCGEFGKEISHDDIERLKVKARGKVLDLMIRFGKTKGMRCGGVVIISTRHREDKFILVVI